MKVIDALSFLLILIVYLRFLNDVNILVLLQFLLDNLVLNLEAAPDDFRRFLFGVALHSRSFLVIETPDLLLIGVIFLISGRRLFLRIVELRSQSRLPVETEGLWIVEFVGLLVGQFLWCEVTQPCFPLVILLFNHINIIHLRRIKRTWLVGRVVILDDTRLANLKLTLGSFHVVDFGTSALHTSLFNL